MENTVIVASEEQLQAACYQWFWNNFIPLRKLLHCNMNNSASRIHGARAKAMGVTPGVSDLELVWYGCTHFIELKFGNGRQSEDQKEFQAMVEVRGHKYYLIYSFEDFKTLIWKITATTGK